MKPGRPNLDESAEHRADAVGEDGARTVVAALTWDPAPPQVVEVEVNSRCNRSCSYCPVSVLPKPDVPRFMEFEAFTRVIDQLVLAGFGGRLSYHFYNEPLLHRELERFVAHAAARLSDATHVLFTNGDLLDDARHASLLEAGLDEFIVTRHDFTEFPERLHQIVRVPTDLDLTNRGGLLWDHRTLQRPCFAPTEMLVVTVTGDVVLCYEDSERKHTFGNVLEQSLHSIWHGDRLQEVRRLLQAGRRDEGPEICRSCNNRTHFKPGESW